MNNDLLMASEAGRVLGRSAEAVRYYERRGMLLALRTANGTRLFKRSDVEALAVKLRGEKSQPESPQTA